MNKFYRQVLPILMLLWLPSQLTATEAMGQFDLQVYGWAEECRDEVVKQFDLLLTSGQLNVPKLFDTFYIPIPNTDPPKYQTQYNTLVDGVVQSIIDTTLQYHTRLVFVIIVDRNGYVPTHNSCFTKPLTGDLEKDASGNRTKRIFNDRTGLAAARNKEPYLLQRYNRDTGETMNDLSVPIFVQNRHWGAVRIAYK